MPIRTIVESVPEPSPKERQLLVDSSVQLGPEGVGALEKLRQPIVRSRPARLDEADFQDLSIHSQPVDEVVGNRARSVGRAVPRWIVQLKVGLDRGSRRAAIWPS